MRAIVHVYSSSRIFEIAGSSCEAFNAGGIVSTQHPLLCVSEIEIKVMFRTHGLLYSCLLTRPPPLSLGIVASEPAGGEQDRFDSSLSWDILTPASDTLLVKSILKSSCKVFRMLLTQRYMQKISPDYQPDPTALDQNLLDQPGLLHVPGFRQ